MMNRLTGVPPRYPDCGDADNTAVARVARIVVLTTLVPALLALWRVRMPYKLLPVVVALVAIPAVWMNTMGAHCVGD
jgi:hypothetical protein